MKTVLLAAGFLLFAQASFACEPPPPWMYTAISASQLADVLESKNVSDKLTEAGASGIESTKTLANGAYRITGDNGCSVIATRILQPIESPGECPRLKEITVSAPKCTKPAR
jgi:hypothetical protein